MVNIYKILNPDTLEVKYIGKTTEALNRRLNKHIHNRGKTIMSKWCLKYKLLNKRPIIQLIERITFDKWEEREKYWISYYKNQGYNLLNITEGGDEGCKGYSHTKEAKARISLLNSRPKSKQWIENAAEAIRKQRATPIIQYNKEMIEIKRWKSFYEAAEFIHPTNKKSAIKNIHSCCNQKRPSAYGYIWRYESIESKDKEL
jgi:hypothetical protein